MKENDINQLCNVYDLCKSELIAGCVQASEKDIQEWWKSYQQLLHSKKSDFRTKEKVILILTKLLAEKSELLEKTEKLETEVAELRARLEKAIEPPCKVMIERTLVNGKFKPTQKAQAFNGRIGVVYRDETRWKGLLVDICSEKTFDYKAAEARLKELQGGEI